MIAKKINNILKIFSNNKHYAILFKLKIDLLKAVEVYYIFYFDIILCKPLDLYLENLMLLSYIDYYVFLLV